MENYKNVILCIIITLLFTGCSKTIYLINGKEVDQNKINLTGHNFIVKLFKKSKTVEFKGWFIEIETDDQIIEIPFKSSSISDERSFDYIYYRNNKYVFKIYEIRYTGNVFQALASTQNTLMAITVYYDADPDSFEPYFKNTDYTRDRNQVFYKTKPVRGADPNSFKVFDSGSLSEIGIDKKNVYIKAFKVKKSDSTTFIKLNNYYSRDKNRIYYHIAGKTIALEKGDGKSAELLKDSSYYLKDQFRVFFMGNHITDADPASFTIITENNDNFGKDQTSVFFEDSKLIGADPNTFIHLGYNYGMDNLSVYYEDKKIEGGDPSSFVVENNRESYDKNNKYIYGELSFEDD